MSSASTHKDTVCLFKKKLAQQCPHNSANFGFTTEA